jgi:hypothetical protein
VSGRAGHRRRGLRGPAAALVAVALGALGPVGVPGWRVGTGAARAQPDREYGTQAPGETPVALPDPTPLARDDRWLFDEGAAGQPAPVLEVVGILAAIDGAEVLVSRGEVIPPTPAGLAISLAGDTTYYVEGRPTTFDQLPEGVPARVTYELRGDRRVALRVEVEGGPAPILPPPPAGERPAEAE